ncbi:MAG: hypothetical protein Hals2KO_08990 [Halioglobus sp.]
MLYGSLFPFRFVTSIDSGTLAHFLGSWRKATGTGDMLGNLALFFPYGYTACLIAARTARPTRTAVGLCLLGIALAVLCQAGQMFTPGRDPSVFDLYMNGIGVALGWLGAKLLPLGSSGTLLGGNPSYHLSLVIAGSWLACQLLPFVPSLDPQVWRDTFWPLLVRPRFLWQESLMLCAAWLMFFHVLHFRTGLRLGAPAVLGGAVLLLTLQVVIVHNYISVSSLVGLGAALLIWLLWGTRLSAHTLAWALLAGSACYALAPFVLWSAPRNFSWLPFEGYLMGSMLINAAALCRKVFIFGAIILILVEPFPNVLRRALAVTCFLVVLEALQRWIGYGTPALTDPLLFLTLSWVIHRQMSRYRERAVRQAG